MAKIRWEAILIVVFALILSSCSLISVREDAAPPAVKTGRQPAGKSTSDSDLAYSKPNLDDQAARWQPPVEATPEKPKPRQDEPSPDDAESTIYLNIAKEPPRKFDVFFGYIRLAGMTTFDYNPLKNRAVVQDLLTSQQNTYALGSTLPYGSKIVQISDKSVIIEKEGKKKQLDVTGELGDLKDMAELKTKGFKQVSNNEWLITPNRLLKNTENIYSLLTQASIRPYMEGDQPGFQVRDIERGAVFSSLGIEDGDVIGTINGETIDSLAKAYEVYQKIRTQPVINVNVKHQDQDKVMSYYVIPDGQPNYEIKEALQSPEAGKIFGGK